MRAGLLAAQPGLAHYFGIRPWEIERLSFVELAEFLTALGQFNSGGR